MLLNKLIKLGKNEYWHLGQQSPIIYLISKINNPYEEVKYLIQNNDSIEKNLKKLKIKANDIKIISNNLKQKKLTNIYAGRTLLLVLKKLDDESNSVVNLIYPINNTLNIWNRIMNLSMHFYTIVLVNKNHLCIYTSCETRDLDAKALLSI